MQDDRALVVHMHEPMSGGVPEWVRSVSALELTNYRQSVLNPGLVGVSDALPRAARIVLFQLRAHAVIAQLSPAIVHLHSTFAALRPPLPRGPRYVYTSHAWGTWRGGYLGAIAKGIAVTFGRSHDAYLGLSEEEVHEATRLGYLQQNSYLVGTASASNPLATVPRRDRPTALFVGRSSPQKGFDLLSEVAEHLDGRVEVIALGQGLSPARNLTCLGYSDDVPAHLDECSVLLQPSRYEGVSLAAIEAALRGVPIVAFDRPGSQWIEKLEAGVLVPFGRCDLMAESAAKIALNGELLSLATRQAVGREFDLHRLAERLENVYNEVLRSK